MKICFVAYYLVATVAMVVGMNSDWTIPPSTVTDFNPNNYMGRWYLMYSSLIPTSSFLYNGYCVTGDYYDFATEGSKAEFHVKNSIRYGSASGDLFDVDAVATNNHYMLAPGKYRLEMDDTHIPFDGFYWVVEVGEVDPTSGQYQWVIVSVPFQLELFILARDVDVFNSDFEEEVLNKVEDYGFTNFLNKPVKVYQSSSDCQYAPEPDIAD